MALSGCNMAAPICQPAGNHIGKWAGNRASNAENPAKNTGGPLPQTPQMLDAGGLRAQTADLQYFILSLTAKGNGNRIPTA